MRLMETYDSRSSVLPFTIRVDTESMVTAGTDMLAMFMRAAVVLVGVLGIATASANCKGR